MKDKRIELLSPAGDFERLKIALLYGADAVYFGGQEYSLRANASNFSKEEIKKACEFAHERGKKVYLTLNIVFHNEDIDGVYEFIKDVVACGIDAFIVSDPFLIRYIKENFKNVEVHLSTQGSTTNIESVKFFQKQGIDRIVLAREVTRDDIKKIIDETGMDIEVFIHGAMCTFYSGRCVLSNYFTNRDSNRGGCSQICRFAFDMDGFDEKFTMATKDLNLSYHIKDMIDIGIKSLKVEGRMRSLYYLATVIGTYRKIIDRCYDNTLDEEFLRHEVKVLGRVANRENSTHYYDKEADATDQYYTGRQEMSNQDFLGFITGYDKENRIVTLLERNYFKVGDEVEIFTPNKDVYSFTIKEMYDEFDNPLDVARHPEQVIKIKLEDDFNIVENSMMRIKVGD